MEKSFTPITVSNMPIYILTLIEIQSGRRDVRKQTLVEEAIEYGLTLFKGKRRGQLEKLYRAKTVSYEELNSPHRVYKIFSGNTLSLSDGPALSPESRMGFMRRRSLRISTSLDEEISKIAEALGISKSFLTCAFIMLYFLDEPKIGWEWKKPMVEDCQKLLARINEIECEAEYVMKNTSKRKGLGEKFTTEDVFGG